MTISKLHALLNHFTIRYLSDRPLAAKIYWDSPVSLTVKSKLALHGIHTEQKWIFEFILNKNQARITYFETFIPGGRGEKQTIKDVEKFLQNELKKAVFNELMNYAKEK